MSNKEIKPTKELSLSTNQITLFATLWFVVLFGALLTIASLLDLQISKFMTFDSLGANSYFSDSQFGLFFEIVGSSPIWLLGTVAVIILFWNSIRLSDK